MSKESVSRRDDRQKEDVSDEEESLFKMNKSKRVVEKVQMFEKLEEDMKRDDKEKKYRKLKNEQKR